MSLLDTASLVITPNGTKAGTLYSVVPSDGSGDMTVTRATTATRVNSAGLIESVASNVPRLDYSNGTCPSILVEPQRTNLFNYSEQFDSGDWLTLNTSITANATTAPNGTNTADKIILNNGSQFNPVVYQVSDTTANTRTLSFFAKASEYDIAFGRVGGATNVPVVLFSLTGSGSILHNQNVSTYSIEALENGWYRCTMTYTHGVSFAPNVGVCSSTYSVSASGVTSTGDGTSGIYIWGAQLEAGSYATSYIPTTSASVTRNADVISKTGIGSLIGQISGTVFIDIDIDSSFAQANARFLDISSNNYDNWYFIGLANTNELVVYFRSNSTVYASALIPFTFGRKKIAFAYANNDYVAYMNGSLVHTDTSVVVGSTSKLTLSNDFEFTSPSKQFTNSVAIWKTRLTNTQLAQLTTI